MRAPERNRHVGDHRINQDEFGLGAGPRRSGHEEKAQQQSSDDIANYVHISPPLGVGRRQRRGGRRPRLTAESACPSSPDGGNVYMRERPSEPAIDDPRQPWRHPIHLDSGDAHTRRLSAHVRAATHRGHRAPAAGAVARRLARAHRDDCAPKAPRLKQVTSTTSRSASTIKIVTRSAWRLISTSTADSVRCGGLVLSCCLRDDGPCA